MAIPINGAVLYHSLLFACQRGINDRDAADAVLPLLGEYIGPTEIGRLLEGVEADDPVETLENLGELLVDSNLIRSFEVIKTGTGFRFIAESCVFAGNVHAQLDPVDVTCPYGLLALYLVERKFGKGAARGVSSFKTLDSETTIDVSGNLGLADRPPSGVGTEEVES